MRPSGACSGNKGPQHTTDSIQPWGHTNRLCKLWGVSWCQAFPPLSQKQIRTYTLVSLGGLLVMTHRQLQNWLHFWIKKRSEKVLHGFVESRSDNVNFSFVWQCMDMVVILLQYTRAHRDGIWNILPYFKCYEHLNYAQWGPVYLLEMDQLPEPILSKFQRGNFVVKISAHR